MATSLLRRNLRLRLGLCLSTSSSPANLRRFSAAAVNPTFGSSPSISHSFGHRPVTPAGDGFESRARYLCSSSPTPPSASAVNPSGSDSKSSSDTKKTGNGESQKSSNSEQDRDSRKYIRVGRVSWMSFFLLAATGAGLIFYYDREKKRHIEGRLL